MINDTLNSTINNLVTTKISYQDWTSMSLSTPFLIAMGICFFSPLIIYLILGLVIRGKSPSGKNYSKPMIAFPNFWLGILVFGIIEGILFTVMILFPLWLKV